MVVVLLYGCQGMTDLSATTSGGRQ